MLAKGKTKDIDSENVLDEAEMIINFVKFCPLSTCLFNVLCDSMGSMHEALSLQTKSIVVVSRKSNCEMN